MLQGTVRACRKARTEMQEGGVSEKGAGAAKAAIRLLTDLYRHGDAKLHAETYHCAQLLIYGTAAIIFVPM